MSFESWGQVAIPHWAIVSLASVTFVLVLLLVKRIVFVRLRNRLSVDFIRALVYSVDAPLSVVVLLLGVVLAEFLAAYFKLDISVLASILPTAKSILLIGALILFVDRLANTLIDQKVQRSDTFRNSKSIVKGTTRGVVVGLGVLIILSTLGISITPVIASLGITSLAVALALQPTLENFFSGVQLVIDKPIRVGDFIELETGEQGFVEEIGWRSTWIKMLPNNIVIIPNSMLAKSKIINYFYPEKELSVPVEVGVHYDSDLEHVEQVTLEVAREILKSHEWGVDEYDTFVVFHTFDSSSINFTVMLRTKEYFNRFFIRSAFIKALHKRYAQEGITIPYPIRALNTEQESARFATSVNLDSTS